MTPWLDDGDIQLYHGDCLSVLAALPAGSVQTCVTSPPYWGLRSYIADGHADKPLELGLEESPTAYVERLVAVFRGVWRVLRDDGTLWLNLGDSYAHSLRQSGADHAGAKQNTNAGAIRDGFKPLPQGLKEKDLVGIPWRVAFALQADGWYLRSDIVWAKPNPMPESVSDRPTKAHEYVFLLSKQPRYYWDADAIREPQQESSVAREARARLTPYAVPGQTPQRRARPKVDASRNDAADDMAKFTNPLGRNVRSVWEIATQPTPEAHFATFPEELVRRCILAGSKPGDTVLDPFMGSGTTALVARKHGRRAIGVELNLDYLHIAARRTGQQSLLGGAA